MRRLRANHWIRHSNQKRTTYHYHHRQSAQLSTLINLLRCNNRHHSKTPQNHPLKFFTDFSAPPHSHHLPSSTNYHLNSTLRRCFYLNSINLHQLPTSATDHQTPGTSLINSRSAIRPSSSLDPIKGWRNLVKEHLRIQTLRTLVSFINIFTPNLSTWWSSEISQAQDNSIQLNKLAKIGIFLVVALSKEGSVWKAFKLFWMMNSLPRDDPGILPHERRAAAALGLVMHYGLGKE
ncbi:hypothetical protein PCANC_21239 [Puccinia coronata f. sp. avenae]|uniref:Uncharacterized protein n=1 Tax=Puccinia coronata f. sp. avenae TaxID=200324 RepID=A0A2N5TL29_9BASI|nr:hypothetical protein PCANC_21239 [Puccinia coronata f. sp. avenae]